MSGIQIGLRDLHYAFVTQDDETGVAYSAPVKIPGIIMAKITPNVNTGKLNGDDRVAAVATNLSDIGVEIQAKDIPLDDQAALLGHTVNGGVLEKKNTDIAPDVAIGFRSVKSNGKYRYYWLLKGNFSTQEQEFNTKGDNVEFQTPTLKGTFYCRDYDEKWQKVADEEHPDYVPSIGTNWFTAVDVIDTTPPTVTVVPANNATAVSVSSSIVWTFNEAIQASTVTPSNFIVQKADGTAQVAGTLSINAARTAVTFTPTANLSAATQYMAIVTTNIKDLAGNALASPSVTKFTTA